MAKNQVWGALGRIARDVLRTSLREAEKKARRDARRPSGVSLHDARGQDHSRHSDAGGRPAPHPTKNYPGDYTRKPTLTYDPHPDRMADPGEVVWTWVPFEENYALGKDRPVLIIGRDDDWLLGLMLSSKDHDDRARDEHLEGRWWCNIGSGEWDQQGRESEVRTDRIIRVAPGNVRRLAGRLDKERFDLVASEVEEHWDD
ncbi:type II toxin-antitoxin system PemK/MazF family toxin [Propionibacterium australiense]|uniref:mRNA interferase PemK-like protein n=1 Tax=Propionibacterium australiense TaxID=119981 RepID=A0A383S9A5_9ACTN|nr:type II toxin-antitoxin system PemK/MazF family toxin [Propionibacterium australiense]SYZ34568.1 mRNA interferase PemK-like protein [Propionibacterium australiense]VEH92709.1 PemK-like protein [Propionibacterium australiense]